MKPRRRTRTRARWLASWRALVSVALVTLLAGFIGVQLLQRHIESTVLADAKQSARPIGALVAARNIGEVDLAAGTIEPARRETMNADITALQRSGGVIGLAVWQLPSGRLLYSDPGRPVTNDTLDDDIRARATTDVITRTSHERAGTSAVEVFLPYDPGNDGKVDGVIEVVLPSDPIAATTTAWTRALYVAVGLAALLLIGGVLLTRRRHRREERAALRDELTGLGNRLMLAEAASRALPHMTANHQLALILLDLDGFKDVNDTLGHESGDALLVAVAERLRTACRGNDCVVRMGGDEFVVLMSGVAARQDAVAAAERFQQVLREPVSVGGLTVEIDASVGLAIGPHHGTDLSTLLKRADVAMYEAKRESRGVMLYDPRTDSREAHHLTLLAELRQAIPAGQLRLYYQPKCQIDGWVSEVEALIRWEHPQHGLLAPGAFVPIAERTPLIKPLTAWVLQESARQCAQWRAEGRELAIALNISARNLVDEDMAANVVSAAATHAIPIDLLRLELTETAMMTDPARASEILGQLKALGVRVSIDDFGVGYTSLSYLSTLPVHTIKIDRKFVSKVLDNPVDEALVHNMIRLAGDLGLDSLAEGVESVDIWRRLAELGCDEIQGYVLTPPLPPDELIAWLDAWNQRPWPTGTPWSDDASAPVRRRPLRTARPTT